MPALPPAGGLFAPHRSGDSGDAAGSAQFRNIGSDAPIGVAEMQQAGARQPSSEARVDHSWDLAEHAERDAWLDFYRCAPERVTNVLSLRWSQVGQVGLIGSSELPATVFNRTLAFARLGRISGLDVVPASRWLERHANPCWRIQATLRDILEEAPNVRDAGLIDAGEEWSKLLITLAAATGHRPSTEVLDVTSDSARRFGRACQVGFDMPPICAEWFEALVGRPGWTCKIAILNGEIAGAGAMRCVGGFAWFGMDSTLPGYRRRGIQADLIASRLADALDVRAVYATAETVKAQGEGPETCSRRNYLRAGFSERRRLNLTSRDPQRAIGDDGCSSSAEQSPIVIRKHPDPHPTELSVQHPRG